MIKKESLKANMLFNACYVTINLIFPLLIFPYVSRVLGPVGIGTVSYALSISTIFSLFANLGLPIYGVREVAKIRDDKQKLSQFVWEMLVLLTISSMVSFAILMSLVFIFRSIHINHLLISLLSINIFLSSLGVEWFYKGIESFRYITFRNFMFKAVGLLLAFLLIHAKTDYIFYAVVLMVSSFGGNIFNIYNVRRYVSFDNVSKPQYKRHLIPLVKAFSFVAITSLYANLDMAMIGVLSSVTETGLYTSANKCIGVITTIVTSVNVALLPRVSNYLEGGEEQKVKNLVRVMGRFLLFIGIPTVVGITILAPQIITAFSGAEFIGSTDSMRVLSFTILFIGFSNLLGVQVMYPAGKENIVLLSVGIGAAANVILNVLLIPTCGSFGASISTLVAEAVVITVQIVYFKKIFSYDFFRIVDLAKYVVATLFMAVFVCFVNFFIKGVFVSMLVSIVLGVLTYFISLVFFKEHCSMYLLNYIRTIIGRKDAYRNEL